MSKLVVNGKEVKFNRKKELEIGYDLSDQQDKVAAQIAYWGEVWAASEAEELEADAAYRHWRAKLKEELVSKNPKLSDAKMMAKIEATDTFIKFKRAIAQAKQNSIICRTRMQAFEKKANLLQSRGAQRRAEYEATGMNTPTKEKSEKRKKELDERIRRVREINLGKKKKKSKKL
jgi:hypothetical protein